MLVMPRIGLRPVELTWARWDGNSLYVRTAKRAGRPERYVPTEHWPPVFKLALGLLIRLVPQQMDEEAFELWRNVLASRLARASKWTRMRRRLSLYCTRHIAIATWKQLGITPELIAKLAGHAGLHSQHHYAARASRLWRALCFRDPNSEAKELLGATASGDAEDVAVGSEQEAQPADTPDRHGEEGRGEGGATDVPAESEEDAKEEFDISAQPKPRPAPDPDHALWRDWKTRQQKERDALEADRPRLRRIRQERERVEAKRG